MVLPEVDPSDVRALRTARAEVVGRIEDACVRVGRDPAGVALVAVSKTVAPDRIRAAAEAGFELFGENRVQEAGTKIGPLRRAGVHASWHLVGHLQANKARPALGLFDMIESVDSVELARRLDRLAVELQPGRPVPVLLEVNVDADPAKAGFDVGRVGEALRELASLETLDLRGLMTVGRVVGRPDEARSTFVALRRLSERLRGTQPRLGPELSMGMTDDFEVAIEEGATIVRIGRAIFGERPSA